VAAVRARARARQDADAAIGPLAHDPQLSTQPGHRFGKNPTNDGLDGQVSISQRINLEGLARLRAEAARAERRTLAERTALLRREVRARAGARWLEAWALERVLVLRRALAEDAQTLLAQTARALELGAADRRSLALARAFAAESRLRAHETEGQLYEGRLALADALGEGAPVAASGELPDLEVRPPEGPRLAAAAETSPEVRAARAATNAERERVRELSATGGWELVAGAQLGREPPGDIITWGLLGITIPVFDKNRREVARAEAAAAERATRADGTLRAARRARYRAAHEVEHREETLRLVAGGLQPAREEALAASRRAFELGAEPLRRVIEARSALAEVEIEVVSARAALVAARHALRLLRPAPTGEGA
jgi:outer membrane protein TolC